MTRSPTEVSRDDFVTAAGRLGLLPRGGDP